MPSVCLFLVDDTLDSVLAGSDDEAEEDAVISQVLDEIGIEVSSKVKAIIWYCVCVIIDFILCSCLEWAWQTSL